MEHESEENQKSEIKVARDNKCFLINIFNRSL